MRIVYEMSMYDKILTAKYTADRLGQRIEKIVLTSAEHDQLNKELDTLTPSMRLAKVRIPPMSDTLFGIRIETE